MEPKNPIVIDGVDVSECECIIEDYQRANNFEGRYEHIKNVCELGERGAEYYNLFCKDNPNCYYKQLKRKEQENQRYGQTLIEIEDIVKGMNIECFYSDFDCKDCDMKNGCIHQGRLKILRKISEVEEQC